MEASMNNLFLGLTLAIAVLDWLAVAKGWRKVEYFAKPGVMVALLAWLVVNGGLTGQMIWFAIGLAFSLAGDVFLMLPQEQFIAGLVSFLLAHVAYLIGFNPSLPPLNPGSLILAVLVFGTAIQIYRRISAGLQTSGKSSLKAPVLVYSIVISLMLLSALITLIRPEWNAAPALVASAGALLFFLSDTLLAWNKFVSALPYGRLLVMVSYHIGQILITIGAAMHYLFQA
jgi:uncharacterized membrane protein YhhN